MDIFLLWIGLVTGRFIYEIGRFLYRRAKHWKQIEKGEAITVMILYIIISYTFCYVVHYFGII